MKEISSREPPVNKNMPQKLYISFWKQM